jgi:PAS domain S-box-containing protein
LQRRLNRLWPRRLTTRITLALVVIVVMAGLITVVAINQVLAHSLGDELIKSGEAIALALGENLANALVEGDLATVQETLNSAVGSNPDVVYAFAFGPGTPIVHTFPDGFPADLLNWLPPVGDAPGSGTLLQTERGLVRDFGYHPLDGLHAEVHLGISQARIAIEQGRVTGFVIALTAAGCIAAALVTYGVSRLATNPLAELTRRVRRLGEGRLDERIDLLPGDEIGDLAAAFNQMADDIQRAIQQLQVSEAGYRDLLTAAGAVGEGIALICDEGPHEGTFLFVNETFSRLTGFAPNDLLGANAASVLHPDSLEAARHAWQAIRADGHRHLSTEIVLVDRHGRPHILETAGAIIDYQDRRALAWFTRDITERKLREEELRRRNRELTALNAVASALSELLSPEEVLDRALGQALAALELDTGWVFVVGEDGRARLTAHRGLRANSGFVFPDCRCGAVLRDGQPVIVSISDERCAARRALKARSDSPACHVTVPVQARGRTLGVLSVAAASPRQFDRAEMDLLAAIGRQMGVALENAYLWEELRQKEQLRGELLARAIRAQEEERQRIARELHDATGQSLNALVFGLNAIATALDKSPAAAPDLVERLRVSASDTVKELQSIIYDLRPALLDDLGLIPALRWYAEQRLQLQGVQVELEVTGEPQRLSSEVETALFRIGQEAITNISRHAGARHVHIGVAFEADAVAIEVIDDGAGFDPAVTLSEAGRRRGLGLLGMKERAALLGGEFVVESEPDRGTRLRVCLSLEPVKA